MSRHQTIATFIAAFTLVIIATAISKMVLYIGEYGMTVLRLTTSAFMVFLAVVFISVVLRIYTTKINMIKTALLAAGCIVVILGTVNVNAVCAKYNYESYKSGTLESIDLQALYDLGDEGIPYLVTLASGKDIVAPQAQTYLATAYLYDYFDDMENTEFFTVDDLKENQKNKGFQYFSIPKAAAYDRLYEFIENNAWFPSVCQTYANEVERDYYDRYDYFFPDF
ncbi:MAG: DUF4173 domain-containing protein [Clostridia bacterium]|nr:DUF4173 domain-containing protein [Clostridia bacterium]